MTVTADAPPAADRTPPANLAAEAIVLGAMMLSKNAIADVVEILTAGDFYRPIHATIFDQIVDLYGRGEPTDAVAVAQALADTGQLARIGGAPYLHTLIANVPTAANGGYYARIVAERATLRRVIEAGTRIVQLGYGAVDGTGRDADHIVDLAQKAVFDISTRRETGDLTPIGRLLESTLAAIDEAGQRKGLRGLPTGFADLDRVLGGLRPGQLIVVAGRPAMGKSVLATDIARRTALHGPRKPVAFFSLEMSQAELMNRLTSAETRVPLAAITEGHLSDNDWSTVARRYGDIEDAPLYIDETPHITLGEIRAKARRLAARQELALIVVDYLQLMASASRADSREREVAEISRGLKILAKEIGCPVIAVAQLNRGAEMRQDKRPLLSDLRESGSIEADADVVILLYREDYYDKESSRAGEADFIIAKNRGGPTDTVTVASQLHFSRFVDMAIE